MTRETCDCGSPTQKESDFCWYCEERLMELLYNEGVELNAENMLLINVNADLSTFESELEG